MADKQGGGSFLQRWSARKAEAREGVLAPEPDDVAQSVVPTPPEGEPVSELEPAPDLPDVDTLDAASDYTAFLGKNVPQDIANLALRKLWRSDPVLANLDGLNDYDGDYSKVGTVSEVVKTLYKVGKGFMTVNDETEAEASVEDDQVDEPVVLESPSADDALISDEDAAEDPDKVTSPDGEEAV